MSTRKIPQLLPAATVLGQDFERREGESFQIYGILSCERQ